MMSRRRQSGTCCSHWRSRGVVAVAAVLAILLSEAPLSSANRIALLCQGPDNCSPVLDGTCVDLTSFSNPQSSISVVFPEETTLQISLFNTSSSCAGNASATVQTQSQLTLPLTSGSLDASILGDLSVFCAPSSSIPSRRIGVDDTELTVQDALLILLAPLLAQGRFIPPTAVTGVQGSLFVTEPSQLGTTAETRVSAITPGSLMPGSPFTVQDVVEGAITIKRLTQVDTGSSTVVYNLVTNAASTIYLAVNDTIMRALSNIALSPGPLATDTSPITADLDCTNTFTVVDVTPPTIVCPAAYNGSVIGAPTSAVAIPFPNITDNGVLASVDVPVTAQLAVNETALATVAAVDSNDNSATCTTLIRGVDTTPPVLSNCVDNITLEAEGDLTALLVLPDITALDRETPAPRNTPQVTYNIANNTRLPLGAHEVEARAVDVSGNVAICRFDVYVTDRPRLTAISRLDVVTSEGDDVSLQCTFTGYPLPLIVWRLQGSTTPVQADQGALTSILRFRRVDFNDFGVYSCEAFSPLGNAPAPLITLTVRPAVSTCPNTTDFLRSTHALANEQNTNAPLFWEQEDSSDIRAVRRDRVIPGRVSSFLMTSDAVLAVTDSEIRAYTRLLSASLWTMQAQDRILTSRTSGPVILDELVVFTEPSGVRAFNMSGRDIAWQLDFNTTQACTGVWLVTDEMLISCRNDSHIVTWIAESTKHVPTLRWSRALAVAANAWPPAFNTREHMFVPTPDTLYKLDVSTGATVATLLLDPTPPTGPPLLVFSDVFVAVTDTAQDRVLSMPDSLARVSWELQLDPDERVIGALSATGSLVVVPTADNLVVLTLSTGARQWTLPLRPPTADGEYELLAHQVLATSSVSLLHVTQYQENATDATTPASTTPAILTTGPGNATATSTTATTTTTTTTIPPGMRRVIVHTRFQMFITTSLRFFESWTEEMTHERLVPNDGADNSNGNGGGDDVASEIVPPMIAISNGLLHLLSGAGPSMSSAPPAPTPTTTVRALSTCALVEQPEVSVRAENVAIIRSSEPRLQVTSFNGFYLDITTGGQTIRLSGVPAAARLPDLLPGATYRIATGARVSTGMALESAGAVTVTMPAAPTTPPQGRVAVVVQLRVEADDDDTTGTAGDAAGNVAARISGNYFLVQRLRQEVCGDIPGSISRTTSCYVRSVALAAANSTDTNARRRRSGAAMHADAALTNDDSMNEGAHDTRGTEAGAGARVRVRMRRAASQAVIEVVAEGNEDDEIVIAGALDQGVRGVAASGWLDDVGVTASVVSVSPLPEIVRATTTTTTTTTTTMPSTTRVSTTTLTLTDPTSSGSQDSTTTIVIIVVCVLVGVALVIGVIVLGVNRRRENKYDGDQLFLQNEGAIIEMIENQAHSRRASRSDRERVAQQPLPPIPSSVDRPRMPLPDDNYDDTPTRTLQPPLPDRPPLPLPLPTDTMSSAARMPLPPTPGSAGPFDSSTDTMNRTGTILPAAAIEQGAAEAFCSIAPADISLTRVVRKISADLVMHLGSFQSDSGPMTVRALQFKTPAILPNIVANLAKEEQLTEILDLKHENLCVIYGMCMSAPPVLVMDYAPGGSVYSFLSHRPDTPLHRRLSIMQQATCGLEYLSSKRIVHGNIWSQELFIHGQTIKLSLAPLQRAAANALNMPHLRKMFRTRIRWAAPETVSRKYSLASDVWALAVTFWEIFMNCKTQPYAHIRNVADVLPSVQRGERLTQPDMCPDELWELMVDCWKANRADRPSVHMVHQVLVDIGEELAELAETSA
ncbi:TK protein kinase [Salpingoeca rosetta]|uniref:TK protein kinase n=1 Tax=Salpingoeca rosetta (strain ATCC 50818 / BSB-021) TaxID=946362 RepID=F2UH34_SALR5|nr:TK protein kinase [Salpingoeca rosetta]EGD76433.1 TK protein kinase [Salpingoeca rosetta]|eukprot:XP_004991348.1 TK protein kinase [Salpingoeca rosetta]